MITAIRRVGNSKGIIIPKPMLRKVGLEIKVEVAVEGGAIVLRKPRTGPRQGWAEASRKIAAASEDKLIWPEFGNRVDQGFQW